MKSTFTILSLLLFQCCLAQFYTVDFYEYIGNNTGGLQAQLDQEDWFGYSVEGIGDLDRDGVDDIAVGVLKDDDGGFNQGAVYILFLNDDGGVEAEQKISATEGGFTGDLDEWDIFGSSLAFLGDINGDGYEELAVGAEYDGDGGHWHGAVWILSLDTEGTVVDHVKISDTEGEFTAPLGDEDVFGTDIELLGDLDGDGMEDIAVSARRDPDGGTDRGAVYILFLNPDLTVKEYQKISDTQGGFQGDLDGQDYFGGSVCNIGDLNGDGVIDLAVGAYRDDDGGANRGAIYILFMNTDGTVAGHQKISDLEGGFNAGFNNEMFFGISIDLVRDINQDEKPEIIVGAEGYSSDDENLIGAFYLLNLNTDGTVDNYHLYTEGTMGFGGDLNGNDSFGFSVAYQGFLEDRDAFAISAFLEDTVHQDSGGVWMIRFGEILSIESNAAQPGIVVYPNPTRHRFLVDRPEQIQSIDIYDMQGTLIRSYGAAENGVYDASFFPVGTYVLMIHTRDGRTVPFKLVIG